MSLSVATAKPKYATKPRVADNTYRSSVDAVAAEMGIEWQPWQDLVLDAGCLMNEDGSPTYDTVVVTVPRQSGKTWLVRGVQVGWANHWEDQNSFYTAQTRLDAKERVLETGTALLRAGYDIKFRQGIGTELIQFPNGSKIRPLSPTEAGGHGMAIDFVVLDECWAVQPRVLQSIVPARAARPKSQMWVISTAGTESSEVLNEMVERGRESVDDPDSRMAYFEWSIPENADPYDEDRWCEYMPALGNTISVASVQAAMNTLTQSEFTRAFGNRRTLVGEPIIPQEWWDAGFDETPPGGEIALAIDVNLGPAGASIALISQHNDQPHINLVDWKPGGQLMWIPDRVKELCQKYDVRGIAIDTAGPVAAIKAEIEHHCEDTSIVFRPMNLRDNAAAAGRIYDMLKVNALTHAHAEPLEAAVAGAQKKESTSGTWQFNRAASANDVSPLIAAAAGIQLAVELELAFSLPQIFW